MKRRLPGALALLLVFALRSGAASPPPVWPLALEEAALRYRASLAAEQEAVRTSSLKSSFGVEETMQFDLATHACHRGPGQAWRDYGAPSFTGATGDDARVRYPYRLQFRQALTLEEMFQKPWREGSDGEIEVVFRRTAEGWKPGPAKDLLVRKEDASKKGTKDGDPRKSGGRKSR